MAAFDFAAPASTNTIVLSLRMDNGGKPAATSLESFTFTPVSTGDQYVTENSISHPLLSSGVTYWFVAVGAGTNPGTFWDAANPAVAGTIARTNDGGTTWAPQSTTQLSAFLVNGDPPGAAVIPEPSTLALLGTSLAGLMGAVWRRRRSAAKPQAAD
jgi:hypothetical protein